MSKPRRARRNKQPLSNHAEANPQPTEVNQQNRRFWIILAAICLVGFVTRSLIVSDYVSNSPFASHPRVDAEVYWDWAGKMAEGEWGLNTPFFSAPLYPYLLGILRSAGGTLNSVYWLQTVCDLLTALLLAYVARKRFGLWVGLLSAVLFFTMQETASSSLRVLASTLQLLLVTATWGMFVAVQANATMARRVILGITLGLLCLACPPSMLIIPFVWPWLFLQSQRRPVDALHAAVPIIAACISISPATIHNLRASGEFIPISAHAGITLYQGNAPGASGNYTKVPGVSVNKDEMHADAAKVFRTETGREGSWKEVDSFFVDKTLAQWKSNIGQTIKLMFRKGYWFFTGRVYSDVYTPALEIDGNYHPRLRLAPVHTAWLALPAILGFAMLRRRLWHHLPELLLFAVPLLVVVVFWYSPRYRLPAVPIIVVMSSVALVATRNWKSQKPWAMASVVSLILAISLGPINRSNGFDTYKHSRPAFEMSLGQMAEEDGDIQQAKQHYERSLEYDPQNASAYSNLGQLAAENNQVEESIELFRKALQIEPDSARRSANLAKALLKAGRFEEALSEYNHALALDPGMVALNGEAGLCNMRLDRPAEAVASFKKAEASGQLDPGLRFHLALSLVLAGERDEAIAEMATMSDKQRAESTFGIFSWLLQTNRLDDAAWWARQRLAKAPDDGPIGNGYAWLLATCPIDKYRNGQEAVKVAERVCATTGNKNPQYLATLAAAYAESGRFDEAIKTQQRVISMVTNSGPEKLLPLLELRLRKYENHQPIRSGS